MKNKSKIPDKSNIEFNKKSKVLVIFGILISLISTLLLFFTIYKKFG